MGCLSMTADELSHQSILKKAISKECEAVKVVSKMRSIGIMVYVLLFTLISYPIRLIRRRSMKDDIMRYRKNYRLLQKLIKKVLWINGASIEVINQDAVNIETLMLFVANHRSHTDSLIMLAVMQTPFVFIGKKEISR